MSFCEDSIVSMKLTLKDLGIECTVSQGKIESIRFIALPPRQVKTDREFRQRLTAGMAEHGINYDSFEDIIMWDRSSFDERVLREVLKIEAGRTVSYKHIAEAVGCAKASRAVGQALKRNKTPILIPCHRVIRVNGDMGGFSGGLAWKRYLLEIERNERMSL